MKAKLWLTFDNDQDDGILWSEEPKYIDNGINRWVNKRTGIFSSYLAVLYRDKLIRTFKDKSLGGGPNAIFIVDVTLTKVNKNAKRNLQQKTKKISKKGNKKNI